MYSFVFLFIIIAPIILFYANGNILGESWNILATGGIFVRSMESGAELYVNGKQREVIGFFTRDYLLKNLKPALYDIEVKKDGYNSWRNKITVVPNRVMESNVFMLPSDIKFTEITEFLIPEGIVSTTTKNIFKLNPDYELINDLFDSSSTLGKYLVTISTTTGLTQEYALGTKENPIKNRHMSLWQENNQIMIGWNGSINSSPRIFCTEELEIITCETEMPVYSFDEHITDFDFFPGESEVVLVAVADKIYALQAENNPDKTLQVVYSGKQPSFRIFNNNLYVKDGDVLGEIEI